MKRISLSIFCIVLVLIQITALSGCAKNEGEYYSVVEVVDDDTASNNASGKDNTVSNNASVNDNKSSQSNSTDSKVTSQTKKTVSKSGTWQEVLKSMPKNLRGKELEIVSQYPMSEIPGVAGAIKKFEKASGMSVKWSYVQFGNYESNLNTRMAADNPPDIVYTNAMVISRIQHFQPIKNLNFDFSGKEWDQQTIKAYTIKGNSYAVALSPEYTYQHQPQAMFYNKNLIKEYGFEDPYQLWKKGKWTFSKMLEMAKEYNKETGNLGFSFGSIYEYPMMKGLCAGPFTFDGKTVGNTFKSVNLTTVFQEMSNWKEIGLLSNQQQDEGPFINNKMLFYTFNFGTARSTNCHCLAMKENRSFGVAPYPIPDGQKTYYAVMGEYEGYAVPKNAKYGEAMPYFIRCIFDKSNYDPNKYFCSPEALDVYNWSMKQKRVMQTSFLTGQAQSNSSIEQMGYKLWAATSNAITTEIASGSNTIDRDVKSLNKTIKDNF